MSDPQVTRSDQGHQRDGFNLIAPLYDQLGALTFGGAILSAQLALLPALRGSQRALMIGGGAGAQLKALLDIDDHVEVIYLEASSRMISLAQRRLSPEQGARVTWVHDVHERLYQEPALLDGVDAVITCFFLDVLGPPEAARLISWVTSAVSREGRSPLWLVADFYPHSGWRGAIIKLMYLAFRMIAALRNQSLVDYLSLAREAGWRAQECERFACGMIYTAVLTPEGQEIK